MAEQKLTPEKIQETLKSVKYPGFSRDIVSFGLVKGVQIDGDIVTVKIVVTAKDANVPQKIEDDISNALKAVPGVKEARVNMTWNQPEGPGGGPQKKEEAEEPMVPDVKVKIAVASGKGGVGKSTVAAGLALFLKNKGLSVGLVDFDIYGPSIPTILGTREQPRVLNNKILPIERDGLKLMSMGFLVEPSAPMIWRGPMVHQATQQFLRDVNWGALDVLVVDLPPGTGDAQMTLAQSIKVDGAVIVSTPQELALLDARKGVGMFQKMDVPILGIVENMSVFVCPECGHQSYIFGKGGAAQEAERLGVPLLAEIPLVPQLVTAEDSGDPMSAIEASPELAEAFSSMAEKVFERIGVSV